MKRLATLAIPIALSACVGMGETEKTVLKNAAIESARSQSKEVHLAYLQCYALRDLDKKDCKRAAKKLTKDRQDAVTWDYILPFEYEAERLGFKTFLQEAGKSCDGVDQGPKYNKETNAYYVICTEDTQYRMRFDYEKVEWIMVE